MSRRGVLLILAVASVVVTGAAVTAVVAGVDLRNSSDEIVSCDGPGPLAVALDAGMGTPQVWLAQPDGEMTSMTPDEVVTDPDVAPDGRHVVGVVADGDFGSSSPPTGLLVVGTDGSVPTVLVPPEGSLELPRWSPDGETIAFVRRRSGREVTTVSADGGDEVAVTSLPEDAEVGNLAWSPDSTRLAYVRTDGALVDGRGTTTVWVVDADGGMPRQVAEVPGASSIDWSGDRLLLGVDPVMSQEDPMRVVDIDTGEVTALEGEVLGAVRWSRGGTHVVGRASIVNQDGYPVQGGVVEAPLTDGAVGEPVLRVDPSAVDPDLYVSTDTRVPVAVVPCTS